MKKKIIITISAVLLITISITGGLILISRVPEMQIWETTTTIEDIVKNPELFIGKNVKVIAGVFSVLVLDYWSENLNIITSIIDNTSAWRSMYAKFPKHIEDNEQGRYWIKGTVKIDSYYNWSYWPDWHYDNVLILHVENFVAIEIAKK